MAIWIFKVSEQELYPDRPGSRYVYDNTHSVHVAARDTFLYLDKRERRYGFTGHGVVRRMARRKATGKEVRNSRVHTIFTAHLSEFVRYSSALDIRPNTDIGKRNRTRLGISDVNLIGWSASIARLEPEMYERIVSLAYDAGTITVQPPEPADYEIPDDWSTVRKRHSLERFRMAVLRRQGFTCANCGSGVKELLDVGHISPYSTDSKNRANPANGIGLCTYCHRAFDRGILRISPGGEVRISVTMERDRIAQLHVSALDHHARKKMLQGVDPELLKHRFELSPE